MLTCDDDVRTRQKPVAVQSASLRAVRGARNESSIEYPPFAEGGNNKYYNDFTREGFDEVKEYEEEYTDVPHMIRAPPPAKRKHVRWGD